MATHSSILAWKIPWTGEPSGLQSIIFSRYKSKIPERRCYSTLDVLSSESPCCRARDNVPISLKPVLLSS